MNLLSQHSSAGQSEIWNQSRFTIKTLYPYAAKHKANFLKGALAALIVVATRIALPWPFRGIVEILFQENAALPEFFTVRLPDATHAALLLGLTFFLLIVLFGLADFLERLWFARFAIGVMRDLRHDAYLLALEQHQMYGKKKRGDLIARLIGDTARIKNGLKGFFVHFLPNFFLFAGVTVILLLMNSGLGLIFVGSFLVVGTVVALSARRQLHASLKHRRKEGKLSDRMLKSMRRKDKGQYRQEGDKTFRKLNIKSGKYEASLTQAEGLTTWIISAVFGVTVLLAIWVGAHAVARNQLDMGDMTVFMMYAIMMRGPIVRLGRYGTRIGKILGTSYRVAEIIKNKNTVLVFASQSEDGLDNDVGGAADSPENILLDDNGDY